MDCFLEKVYEARDTITKMSNEKIPKKRITEEVTVSFAEFVLAMHLVCVNKSTDNTWTDLREVAQAMLSGTPELSNWIAARRPCENELQSRWELKMLTRHEDAYQVLISDGKYRPPKPRLGRRFFEVQPGLPERGDDRRAPIALDWAAIENTEIYGDDCGVESGHREHGNIRG